MDDNAAYPPWTWETDSYSTPRKSGSHTYHPANTKGLTFYNKYQANNVFNFLCFHRADVHPPVTADFLRNKPGMVKLMNSLWNAGTVIPLASVPKIERVTTKIGKKATYVRTQQLATAVLRPLIRIFGRALNEQHAPKKNKLIYTPRGRGRRKCETGKWRARETGEKER